MTKAVIVLNDIFFERAFNRDFYNKEIIQELQGKPLTVYIDINWHAVDAEDEGNEHLVKYMTEEGRRLKYFATESEFEIIMEK